jgi:hypothetical protein
MQAPSEWTIQRIVDYAHGEPIMRELPDGRWVRARPEGLYSIVERIRLAWLVFTGQADALKWDGQ